MPSETSYYIGCLLVLEIKGNTPKRTKERARQHKIYFLFHCKIALQKTCNDFNKSILLCHRNYQPYRHELTVFSRSKIFGSQLISGTLFLLQTPLPVTE